MLEVRRILQLKKDGVSNRKIAKICGLSRPTVNLYVTRLNKAEKSFDELLLMNDEFLSYYSSTPGTGTKPVKLDERYEDFHKRLPDLIEDFRKPKVTRMILWEEYREENPGGYGYTQFCELFSRFLNVRNAVMHLEHKPAEECFFDFAGDKLYYIDTETGESVGCAVFVAVLPFSGYTYMEALPSQKRLHLLDSMNNMLQFYGGVTQSVKSDNMRQYVIKANKYEPVFDELIKQWSLHYNTTLLATRVLKPRDKASVESAVNSVYNRVYACMHRLEAHSINELNFNIRNGLKKFNAKKMQKHSHSRFEYFSTQEKPLLRPLPEKHFIPKTTIESKVRPDYHITIGENMHYYSVPHQYIGKRVRVVYDTDHVEIYLNHERIAVHNRDCRRYKHTTIAEHMPASHQNYKGWSAEFFLEKAGKIGANTQRAVGEILKKKSFVEQNYNSCLGLLRLATTYSELRLEAACTRALTGPKITYIMIKNILEHNLDQAPEDDLFTSLPQHDNLRGEKAFEN